MEQGADHQLNFFGLQDCQSIFNLTDEELKYGKEGKIKKQCQKEGRT
jgi:hypothetical protein